MADGLRAICGFAEAEDWRPRWRISEDTGENDCSARLDDPAPDSREGFLAGSRGPPPEAEELLRDAEVMGAALAEFLSSLTILEGELKSSDNAAIQAKLAAISESQRLRQDLEALSAQKREREEALVSLESLFDLYGATVSLGELYRAHKHVLVDAAVGEKLEKAFRLEKLLRDLKAEVDEVGFVLEAPAPGPQNRYLSPGAGAAANPQDRATSAARNAAVITVSGATHSATASVLQNLDDSIIRVSLVTSMAARAIGRVSIQEFSVVGIAQKDMVATVRADDVGTGFLDPESSTQENGAKGGSAVPSVSSAPESVGAGDTDDTGTKGKVKLIKTMLQRPIGQDRLLTFGFAGVGGHLPPVPADSRPGQPGQPDARSAEDQITSLTGQKMRDHITSFVLATDRLDALGSKFDTTGFTILNSYIYDNFSCYSAVYSVLEAVLAKREKQVSAFGKRCSELLLEKYSIVESINGSSPRGLWLYYLLLRVFVLVIKEEGRALYRMFALDAESSMLEGGSLAGAINSTLVLREKGEAGGFIQGAPIRGSLASDFSSPNSTGPPPGDLKPQGILRSSLRWIRNAGVSLPGKIVKSVAGLFTESVHCGIPAIQECFDRQSLLEAPTSFPSLLPDPSGVGAKDDTSSNTSAKGAADADSHPRSASQITPRNLQKRGPVYLNQVVLDFLVRCFWRLIVQVSDTFCCFQFHEVCRQANRESISLVLVDGPETARKAQVEQFLARTLDVCLELTADLPFLREDGAR